MRNDFFVSGKFKMLRKEEFRHLCPATNIVPPCGGRE